MSILLSNQAAQQRTASAPIISNHAPSTAPQNQIYPLGQVWVDTSTDIVYTLTSFTNGLAFWQNTIPGAAGTFTDLTVTPGPTAIDGEFRVNGNINEAEVIRLQENAGPLGTINIEALQGTAAGSINIQSVSGGIEVTTNGAAGDIAITSDLGRVTIGAGEDIADAIALQATGGISSSILIESTTGTGADSVELHSTLGGLRLITDAASGDIEINSQLGTVTLESAENAASNVIIQSAGGTTATMDILNTTGTTNASIVGDASIGMVSTAGGIGIGAGKDYYITAVDSSIIEVSGVAQVMSLQTTDGAINLDANGANGIVAITANNATTSALALNSVAGGVEIDAIDASYFAVTGAAKDLTLNSTGGSVNISATEAAVDAISIFASAGGVEIDAVDASNFTVTGVSKDLLLSSVGGSVNIAADEAAIDAIVINASNAAGGIDVNAGTGGVIVDTTGAISLDAAAASNFTATGAFDVTVSSTAGSVVIDGGEAVANAIQLTASNAVGGLDLNAGSGGVAIDSTGAISIDASAASNFTVTGAFDLTLDSTAGGVNIDGAGAVALSSTASNVTATAIDVILTASAAAADAIQLTCTDIAGGVLATVGSGNFVVAGGDLEVSTAAKGVILGSGLKVVDGAGSPDTVVTSAKGSLYLRTDGTGVNDRAYINTDGATAWTAIVTVA